MLCRSLFQHLGKLRMYSSGFCGWILLKPSLMECSRATMLPIVTLPFFESWLIVRKPFFSKYQTSLLLIIFSMIFSRQEVSEKRRYKSGLFAGLSGFRIGITTALFHESGTYAFSNNRLNRWRICFLLSSLRFFSIELWVRSHPIAWLLRLLIPISSS